MFKLKQILAKAILCFTALISAPITAQDNRPLVALFDPTSMTDEHNKATSRITTADKMIILGALERRILANKQHRLVDRTRSQMVSMENTYIRSNSVIDISKVKEMGRILQADLVCVTLVEKNSIQFTAICSLIDVVTGETYNSDYDTLMFESKDKDVQTKNAKDSMQIRDSMEKIATGMLRPESSTQSQERLQNQENTTAAIFKTDQMEEAKRRLLGNDLKRALSDIIWGGIIKSGALPGSRGGTPNTNDFKLDVDISNLTLDENEGGDRYSVAGQIKVTLKNLRTDRNTTAYVEIKPYYVAMNSVHDEIMTQVEKSVKNIMPGNLINRLLDSVSSTPRR